MKLSNWKKVLICIFCLVLSVVGFMLKLPSGFRHIDKELHSAFYFFAAAFLNLLFAKRSLVRHIAIFILLSLFGMAIELAQEYSNKFFRKRIHGRYDVEDIQANLQGLILFSIIWVSIVAIQFTYNKLKLAKAFESTDARKNKIGH